MSQDRPFVSWIEMETICSCLRRRCKHKRAVEARNLAQRTDKAQVDALTDGDVAWLRGMGWDR